MSKYLNDGSTIDNPSVSRDKVGHICPPELHLNKANGSDNNHALISDLHASCFIKIYDKR